MTIMKTPWRSRCLRLAPMLKVRILTALHCRRFRAVATGVREWKDGSGQNESTQLAGLRGLRHGRLPVGNWIFLWKAGPAGDERGTHGAVPLSVCVRRDDAYHADGETGYGNDERPRVELARARDAVALGGAGDSDPVHFAV